MVLVVGLEVALDGLHLVHDLHVLAHVRGKDIADDHLARQRILRLGEALADAALCLLEQREQQRAVEVLQDRDVVVPEGEGVRSGDEERVVKALVAEVVAHSRDEQSKDLEARELLRGAAGCEVGVDTLRYVDRVAEVVVGVGVVKLAHLHEEVVELLLVHAKGLGEVEVCENDVERLEEVLLAALPDVPLVAAQLLLLLRTRYCVLLLHHAQRDVLAVLLQKQLLLHPGRGNGVEVLALEELVDGGLVQVGALQRHHHGAQSTLNVVCEAVCCLEFLHCGHNHRDWSLHSGRHLRVNPPHLHLHRLQLLVELQPLRLLLVQLLEDMLLLLLPEHVAPEIPHRAAVHRLGDVVVRPVLQALVYHGEVLYCGENNDREVGELGSGSDFHQELHAVHLRHHQIADKDVVGSLLEQLQRLARTGGGGDVLVASLFQDARDELPRRSLIVNEE
mmetsp:Transcript_1112/g.3991  ORF Transcript_1112/g.3991 Transcript_1112/m.3991 type:complete len:449 (-) Transcript_1112:164-1510(-)